MEDEGNEQPRVVVPELEDEQEDVLVTNFENAGREAFRGRSNVLFSEDFLNEDQVIIEFRENQPLVPDPEYDVDRWVSESPFSVRVRIVEYNQPSDARFHLARYSLLDVKGSYARLERLLERYKFVGLQNKTSGLVWKHKVKRSWQTSKQVQFKEPKDEVRKRKFLEYLTNQQNVSLSKAAKKFSFSYNKAWRIYFGHFNPKTPKRVAIAHSLSQVDLEAFVSQRYFNSSYVAQDWRELTRAIKREHPILQEYSLKTIQTEVRKRTNLRAISIKRKPAQSNTRALLQRQLLVGSDILNLIASNTPVCFFDETVISEKNFKKTAIGNSSMMPLVANYTISKVHLLVLFSLSGQVAVQISSVPNTGEATVNFFKQAIPKFLDRNLMKKVVVVLDNASVQKTANFKDLVQTLPLDLLYNIPCSPFLNLVEDFFLQIKKSFKTHYYQNKENCLGSCLQAIKDELRKGNFDWMLRKLVSEIKGRLAVHKFDKNPFSQLTDLLKRRLPEDLGKREPTSQQGIADLSDEISKPTKKVLRTGDITRPLPPD